MSAHSQQQPVVAIVVAAGSGSRLGASVPKALVELDGISLVRRSVAAMFAGGVTQCVVTIPDGFQQHFDDALIGLSAPVVTVVGGGRRQDSVSRGLEAIDAADDPIVLIHDAARPLVPQAVVHQVVAAVADGAACVVPAIEVVDTIRRVGGEGSAPLPRAELRAVQTPQAARLSTFRNAHRSVAEQGIEVTDDAAACELDGHAVTLVPGSPDSLKITRPADLAVAATIVKGRC